MGILLCEQNFRDVWIRNKSVRAEIGQILHTHTHTTAAKLVVRMIAIFSDFCYFEIMPEMRDVLAKMREVSQNAGFPARLVGQLQLADSVGPYIIYVCSRRMLR